MLIGRARELERLDACVRDASAGQRGIVMITGEPGIGKTRLLEELASRMDAVGGRAVWGRTWEVGLTPAYWPWMQVLDVLECDEPAPALVGLDDRADASSRLARFDAVAAFLVARAGEAPLAILLDDLHAADPSSLLLLEYIARHVRSARLLIAVTARDGEAAGDVELVLARIRRDARRIALGRLDPSEVARLVGDRATPALLRRVHELSEGNPLFVEELVACIDAHGGLDAIAQVTGVRAVILDRMSRLPDDTARVLSAAALMGREVRGAVLAEVLEISPVELDRRLGPAARLGVITRVGSDRYRFSHALVAESLADELPPAERAALHLRAARAIERHDDDGASAIAHHLLAAGPLSGTAAVEAAERAAAIAMAQLAFEDAAALLERALEALAPDDPEARRRRAALLCGAAEAWQHAGEHARAGELCARAAKLAREAGDGVALARIALARGIELQFGSTDRVLVELLREALERMPAGDSALRARCIARLAAAEQPALDPSAPVAAALAAIAMARRIGDRRTRLDVLHVAVSALIEYVRPELLDELLRELFELATSPGDRLIVLRNRLRHCFVTLELCDRAVFHEALAAHADVAGSLGTARGLWPVPLLAAMLGLLEGRFVDAAAAADEARRSAAAAGDPQGERSVQFHRLITAWTRTEPYGELARGIGEGHPIIRGVMRAWTALDQGDRDSLPALLAAADDYGTHDTTVAAMLAEATAACGDAVGAARLYDRLSSMAGRVYVASMLGFALQDFYDRCLLVLAATAGRWEVIDQHARTALELAGRLRAAPWIARIRADWAAALDRRGAAGDAAAADELWRAARADATRLAMPGLEARCRAARQQPDAPPAASAAAAPLRIEESVTIGREGELWIVCGAGAVARVRDSRGIQMLARLVAERGREVHVLELVGEGGGVDTGDAGELLDGKAKAAYRARLATLTQELEEADAWADAIRADRAREEIDALAAELQRAIGLGGRDRRAGQASERARTNAQRRLSHAIQQLRMAAPALGEHFARSVRTGTYCVYDPGAATS